MRESAFASCIGYEPGRTPDTEESRKRADEIRDIGSSKVGRWHPKAGAPFIWTRFLACLTLRGTSD
jgi:hypothetical protein